MSQEVGDEVGEAERPGCIGFCGPWKSLEGTEGFYIGE